MAPRSSSAGRRTSQSVRRQRQILVGLVCVAIVLLLLSLVPGFGLLLIAHFVTDLMLALYVVVLLRFKQGVLHNNSSAPRTMSTTASPYSPSAEDRIPWAS